MSRSLNKVVLIGNLTRDPELRYTPQGTAVCTFGLATNRQWTTESGEKKEEVEYHRIVAWNRLAELCAQLLAKGRKVFIEGRLQTRRWMGQDGQERLTTEIVASDMIILDSRPKGAAEDFNIPEPSDEGILVEPVDEVSLPASSQAQPTSDLSSQKKSLAKTQDDKKGKKKDGKDKDLQEKQEQEQQQEEEEEEDIPF